MDAGHLASVALPYLSAALSKYGPAILDQFAPGEASVEVRLGGQLLHRLMTSVRGEQLHEAATDLAEHPDDDSAVEMLRAQVRRALSVDPELAQDVMAMLAETGREVRGSVYNVNITGSQGVQIGDNNTQSNRFR